MKTSSYLTLLALLASLFGACRPYKNGPILKKESIRKTFTPLVKELGLTKGVVFADIGAQNGLYDVAFATLTKGVTYYIQDIDQEALQEFDKVAHYYTKKTGELIKQNNTFHVVVGEAKKTLLPDNAFDVIHANGVFHAIRFKKALMRDIHKKLKSSGFLFIRDKIVKHGVLERCKSDKCDSYLASEEQLLGVMQATGFKLVKKTTEYGYPMYKFQKVN